MIFAAGLAIIWCGVSLIPRSLPLSLATLTGGCAVAVLGAASVIKLEPGFCGYLAWPAAGLLGALMFRYGPGSTFSPRTRILIAGVAALFVGSWISGAYRPLQAIIGALIALLLWFALARYKPTSRRIRWLRNAAYSAMVLYAASAYMGMHSAQELSKRGCFVVARLPFGFYLRLPHPYDYYVTGKLTKYVFLGSLFLAAVCSLACLGAWLLTTYRIRASRIRTSLT